MTVAPMAHGHLFSFVCWAWISSAGLQEQGTACLACFLLAWLLVYNASMPCMRALEWCSGSFISCFFLAMLDMHMPFVYRQPLVCSSGLIVQNAPGLAEATLCCCRAVSLLISPERPSLMTGSVGFWVVAWSLERALSVCVYTRILLPLFHCRLHTLWRNNDSVPTVCLPPVAAACDIGKHNKIHPLISTYTVAIDIEGTGID